MILKSSEGKMKIQKLPALLILETDEIQSKGLAIALMKYFSTTHITHNPSEAIKLTRLNSFSLIISETHFESMNEFEVVKSLKRNNPDAEVFLTSSHFTPATRSRFAELDIRNFFEKPLEVKKIQQKINDLITYFILKNQ